MANTGRSFEGVRKVFALEPQGHVDQGDEHRHLDQGTDHRGEGFAGVDPEHGHGNGQFKVVGSGSKGKSGCLFVSGV